jgi:hypothetical protein
MRQQNDNKPVTLATKVGPQAGGDDKRARMTRSKILKKHHPKCPPARILFVIPMNKATSAIPRSQILDLKFQTGILNFIPNS